MVLCKITRVMSAMSNSTVVFSQSFVATTKGTNCSRTEQIPRHSLTVSVSDADFVQSAQKEELSLDQAVNLGNRESCKFRVIRFGSSIITQIPRNLHHFSYFLQGKECIEQERESRKFHVIHFGSSLITQILRNSHHFFCFLWTQLRIEIRELKFARFAYLYKINSLYNGG